MTALNTFATYVQTRLHDWGSHFALHRDCEYLGHQSKNMLQVLIEHRGEMPARPTGFKPLEVDSAAFEVELLVHEIGIGRPDHANVLRAWYAGRGRVGVERLETACELIGRKISRRAYYTFHEVGFAMIEGALLQASRK
jgi:hypothetical protein